MASQSTPLRLSIVVTRGPDEGARLDVDECLRIIGRARDADLVLTDLSVSRRHLDVQLANGGVLIRSLPDTAPFVSARQAAREAVLPLGAALIVGSSVLSVVQCASTQRSATRVERTDARTLLQGPSVEVRGLAAVSALMEALDEATTYVMVEEVLTRWCQLHADATRAVLHLEDRADDGDACEEHTRSANDVVVRELGECAAITAPAHAQGRAWVTFSFDRPASALGEAQRRMLLVAGRLTGSSLARIRAVDAVTTQLNDVRQQAIGSARAFLGTSPAAEKLSALIPRVAASDASALIQGETGAGKTFVARLIHELSARSREPLKVVNCAAIPEALLESELFGHERGAFTGAINSREGAFEAVGRGTLFLDELGELPLASQSKLLRALEEHRFERLGSNRSLELKARIICATNRDLSKMVKEGAFRSDLLFRVSVITLRVPPLRERGEDLILLAQQILADLSPSAGRRVIGFSEKTLDAVRAYSWPGNVRELRNAIEHALVLGDAPLLHPEDLPETVSAAYGTRGHLLAPGIEGLKLPMTLERVEQVAIQAALEATGGNRKKAAALLGITRQTLYNKLRIEEAPVEDC